MEIVCQLSKRYSIRKINKLTGSSRDAILRLAHVAEQHANSMLDEFVRYLKVREALFDVEQSSVEKK